MSNTFDDLTVNYEDGGTLVSRQLDKVVLTKGAWSTIMFKYQDFDRTKQDWGPVKFTIRRYQKRNDQYFQKSKFNISSVDQANKIIAALNQWISEAPAVK